MYVPKKLKWDNLVDFKRFLERETAEKIVLFDGWRLITETTEYGIVDGMLYPTPKQEKIKEEPKQIVKIPLSKKSDVQTKSKKQILEEMKARGKKVSDKKRRLSVERPKYI